MCNITTSDSPFRCSQRTSGREFLTLALTFIVVGNIQMNMVDFQKFLIPL